MGTQSIYVWAIVLVGLVGTTATVCVLLLRGAPAAGFRRRVGTTVAVVAGTAWASWVLASAALADAGVYRFAPAKAQPWLPAAMTVSIAAVLLASRVPAVSRILGQPDALWRLTVPQIFRVEGVTFLIVMALGKLPAGLVQHPRPPRSGRRDRYRCHRGTRRRARAVTVAVHRTDRAASARIDPHHRGAARGGPARAVAAQARGDSHARSNHRKLIHRYTCWSMK